MSAKSVEWFKAQGGPITHSVTASGIAAINTIWQDAKHASRVILTTVQSSGLRAARQLLRIILQITRQQIGLDDHRLKRLGMGFA